MKWDKQIERAIVAVESLAVSAKSIATDLHALRDAGFIMARSAQAQQRTARASEQLASSRDAYEGGRL